MAKGYLQDVEWIDFYGRPIITGFSEEFGYVVPMKHIVEDHLGLEWEAQRKKLNASTVVKDGAGDEVEVYLYHPVVIPGYDLMEGMDSRIDNTYNEEDIPEFLPNQEYVCLPVKEINLYLAQININRVNIEARRNLYKYQTECGAALHDYWFRGFSVNNRSNPSRSHSEMHEWCPRELSSKALVKASDRYSKYAQRQHEQGVDPEQIEAYCRGVIGECIDIESDVWDEQDGTAVFIIAFMERAAYDILYFSMEGNVPPCDLEEVLRTNIMSAWDNMGSLIIAVQPPYNAFPSMGRGSKRELV